ncbi:Aste57867_14299 [Aphanomyces stellatus]|uniref:Aste57867_14299 protein n=1 Tax=Aphanomyces stellatus TaxID=120398 RepID=A0A485L0C7_9STRA|nr:hypothetical protein As57867_014246 [Aphanomyces stellatus]VFT91124.1 Aste57867_14299 [Aphanomyces stellatus]
MCSKDNLVSGTPAIAVLECTVAVILLGLGAGLSNSYHFHMALGSQVHNVGGGFIFLSLLYPVVAVIGFVGGKYHNKFLLLLHLGGLIALAVMQMFIALSGLVIATPDFPYAFQDTCLTNGKLNNQTQLALCQEYFRSDTFGGLRLAWRTYYTESLADVTAGSGGDYSTTPLCYASGVCQFDLPIGSCGMSGAGLNAKGCASALQQSLSLTVRRVRPLGWLIPAVAPDHLHLCAIAAVLSRVVWLLHDLLDVQAQGRRRPPHRHADLDPTDADQGLLQQRHQAPREGLLITAPPCMRGTPYVAWM